MKFATKKAPVKKAATKKAPAKKATAQKKPAKQSSNEAKEMKLALPVGAKPGSILQVKALDKNYEDEYDLRVLEIKKGAVVEGEYFDYDSKSLTPITITLTNGLDSAGTVVKSLKISDTTPGEFSDMVGDVDANDPAEEEDADNSDVDLDNDEDDEEDEDEDDDLSDDDGAEEEEKATTGGRKLRYQ